MEIEFSGLAPEEEDVIRKYRAIVMWHDGTLILT